MSYCPEPESQLRDKINIVLELSIQATEKVLAQATRFDTSDLADFISLKAEVEKLDNNKFVNVTTNLNNLKTKVDDLDACKLKNVSVDLKNQVTLWIMKLLKTQDLTH